VIDRGLWLLGAVAIVAAAAPNSSAKAPAVHSVAIRGMQFSPAQVTAHAGDKVRWTNEDLVPHTATANGKQFDSAMIQPGASWEWTVAGKGELPYSCQVHPTMKGSIVVR